MLVLIGFFVNRVWMVFMIEVMGWLLVNYCIGVGMVLVGMNVELMNGRKISGYEKVFVLLMVLVFRFVMIVSYVSVRVNSIRMLIILS